MQEVAPENPRKGIGLNLRVSLIVLPLVAGMLVLALMPIRSYLGLQTAMDDVRRELAFVLHVCRFDIQALRQSVEYFDIALRGEDEQDLQELAKEGRESLDALARSELAPHRAEQVSLIQDAYAALENSGAQAIELSRRGEREAARRLVGLELAEQRDVELMPRVDAAQIEGSLAVRKALDSLLATSAQLARVPSLSGLEAHAKGLRREAAEAISVCRFAREAQRLLGEYRRFAYFGESRVELAVAEHEFDHAYRVWEAQVAARGHGGGVMSATGIINVEADYRAMKRAIDQLSGHDREAAQTEAIRIFESELAPLGDESLPGVLAAAFDAHEARLSARLDSISMQARVGGTALAVATLLALGLALVCPWLISRWIVRPVLALTRAARELGASGGSGPVAVHAGGEIGELAASFNRMAEQLAERTRELEEERARERLRHAERLAAVGSLAAGLAHQINNPINNILLTAEHALGERGPEAAESWRQALNASAEEAKRCERIVRGLVAFSRGEPGQREREDAHQALRRVYELTADTAAQQRAEVELRLGREPAPILANTIALEQSLVNIVRNAIQSRPGARVILTSEVQGETVRLKIQDDGRGLDRTALSHLFDPFYTTRADEGGIGLGLSVAHRIIADHGGEIRVDSEPGEGTTFTVELPLDLPRGERR